MKIAKLENTRIGTRNKKPAFSADSLADKCTDAVAPDLSKYRQANIRNFVKLLALEVRGFAPPDSWMAIQSPLLAHPTAFLLYHFTPSLQIREGWGEL